MSSSTTPQGRLEAFTQEYLVSLAIGDVVSQPEGCGKFPDFRVSTHIAVESTLLTKPPAELGGRSQNSEMPGFLQSLRNVVENSGASEYEKSWFVNLRISSISNRREARAIIRRFLENFNTEEDLLYTQHNLNNHISLEIYPAYKRYDTKFRLRRIPGLAFSGWVVPSLLECCEYAIQRKEPKISRSHGKYEFFWLAVGGCLANGLSDDSYSAFCEHFCVETRFDALLLINGFRPSYSRFLEL